MVANCAESSRTLEEGRAALRYQPHQFMGYNALGGQFIAVLIDFDLSSTKRDGLSGFECIGTVPFMALDLLTPEAIAGDVEHMYRHDAESFIWVLT
ncbi:hypothetical protein EDD22DRAFT_883542 [Suillus occidentalis]|nr:hypothetical protein EDD22DRAFT_883542 [Suillus occidentalis]